MGNESSDLRRQSERNPSPEIKKDLPSPLSAAPTSASIGSPGSVPIHSPMPIQIDSRGGGSDTLNVNDEPPDFKKGISPAHQEEEDTPPIAPPSPVADVEVMEGDGNLRLGNQGEPPVVVDEKEDEAMSNSSKGLSLENSEAGVVISDEEENSETVKMELTTLAVEKIRPDNSAVDEKEPLDPLHDESNLLQPVTIEPYDGVDPAGALTPAKFEFIAASSHSTGHIAANEEVLSSKPLEAESTSLDSAKIETNDHIDVHEDALGENESKALESGEDVDIGTYDFEATDTLEDLTHNDTLKVGSKIVEHAVAEGSAAVLEEMDKDVEASNSIDQNLAQPIHVTVSLNNFELDNEVAEVPIVDQEVKSAADDTNVTHLTISLNNLGLENEVAEVPILDQEVKSADDDTNVTHNEDESMGSFVVKKQDGLPSDGPAAEAIIGTNEAAMKIIEEMMQGASETKAKSNYTQSIDGQIVTDSEEEIEADEEDDGKELFDSAILAALLRAETDSSADNSFASSYQDSGKLFSVDPPAGLGSGVPALKPAPGRSVRPPAITPSEVTVRREEESNMNEEERKLHEQVDQIRVKFLRLVRRLKHSIEDAIAAQVLYRLGLAEGIRTGRHTDSTFDLENAKQKALELEAEGKDDLNFSCSILIIGKTGVGKSAIINSIFGEERAPTNAFEATTVSLKEISGIVDGVKIRVIDTPGLNKSALDQSSNKKILSMIKKYMKKSPPDIVLYVDRLDTQTRDLNDLPLLQSITKTLGSSVWFNAIVALTHAGSAPPDGPNGSPLSYEVLIAQRSHVVQHSIRRGAGDMRLMNPVTLVENHPSCRRNKDGERILPNGLSWRLQMLLLCYSSKILSESNSLLKLRDPPANLFRPRSLPLPVILSSLLQSRVHPKLSADQGGENVDSDLEVDGFSDEDKDKEEDHEYDQLPPFKPLKKAQIAKLTKEQRKAYFEEYDYRVKLLQKKQWKEEIRRMKEMKKREKTIQYNFGYSDTPDDFDQEAPSETVPVPLPDMILPPSFDCENPVYRYRFLEPTSQLLTRPVLDTQSWDHDCGYDGVSIENCFPLAGFFPVSVATQITKDKKDFSIHLDSSICMKHAKNSSTLACFEIQPIGRQLGYTLRGETKFNNLKKNKITGGMSVTFLGESVANGVKLEDQMLVGKRLALAASAGAVRVQGDMAYGANLEARLRDRDFPIGQALTTLGLSLLNWRGDLALGANMQSHFSIGRSSKMNLRVGLNNKLTGQITVKTSSSEHLQLALLAIFPFAASIVKIILCVT